MAGACAIECVFWSGRLAFFGDNVGFFFGCSVSGGIVLVFAFGFREVDFLWVSYCAFLAFVPPSDSYSIVVLFAMFGVGSCFWL